MTKTAPEPVVLTATAGVEALQHVAYMDEILGNLIRSNRMFRSENVALHRSRKCLRRKIAALCEEVAALNEEIDCLREQPCYRRRFHLAMALASVLLVAAIAGWAR